MHRMIVVGVALLLLCGCATTDRASSIDTLVHTGAATRILLMPVDVNLYLVTASGINEPNAEWTEAARQHVAAAVTAAFHEQHIDSMLLPKGALVSGSTELALQRLHETVGRMIMLHTFDVPLPAKRGRFDWTLGRSAAALKKYNDADYALFVFIRDSYASGGRIATRLLAPLSIGLIGGLQQGFASLVDLRSGDIVWFNRLVSYNGDLRTPAAARRSIALLLRDFPGS